MFQLCQDGFVATQADRANRRIGALSKKRIVSAAVEILDVDGESALTFRALAARLLTGAGAIYWHVTNKDELLAEATSLVIAGATSAGRTKAAPHDDILAISLALFDAFDAHPWIGSQLLRQPGQLGDTQIFEALGSKLGALGVPLHLQFDAASALSNYISGAASQNAGQARAVPTNLDRATFLSLTADRWEQLDAAEFPFVHQVLAQMTGHNDRAQFIAGIEFLLTGITSAKKS